MDVVTSFYNVEKDQNPERLKQVPLPVVSPIPGDVVALLAGANLKWDALPRTAKNAVLWSLGYVRYGSEAEYTRVLALCPSGSSATVTMDSIQVSDKAVACDTVYSYCGYSKWINKACSAFSPSLAKCAINTSAVSSRVGSTKTSVYWGYTVDNYPLPPDVTLLKNDPLATSIPYSIHIQPVADLCATTSVLASTVPCINYTPLLSSTCAIAPSMKMQAWLTELSQATTLPPTPLSTSTPPSPVISPSTTPVQYDGNSLVLGLAGGGGGALVLVMLLALFCFYRRKANKRASPPTGTTATSIGSNKSCHSHVSSSKGMSTTDMDQSNDRLCATAPVLKSFQVDPAISFKRLDYVSLVFERHLATSTSPLYDVWLGHVDRDVVAIKQLAPSYRCKKGIVHFASSVRLMVTLDHPNITSVVGVGWDMLEHLCLVTEFMDRGSLRENLDTQAKMTTAASSSRVEGEWSWKRTKLNVAMDVAKAMVYLHTLEVPLVHAALTSSNVLLNCDEVAKLSAFAVQPYPLPASFGAVSSKWEWVAPEVLSGQPTTPASDVYAFGVVLTELDTLAYPYAPTTISQRSTILSDKSRDETGDNARQKMQSIVHDNLRPALSPTAPPALRDLVELCLHSDPSQRPSAMMLIYHLRSKVKVFEL
ncbi:TKL protein kinase [Aphanomyces astaci]|uniref:TKL protein kinase n=1 Tax=Aphanomyces astaci TaxID=112090 RepID=W4H092_APHAT|nr:TKL protein kinase [Aphanomyces astaci]ETV85337.1 TKL protein kinase [Aphanomyces astaci]RQM19148.1 hypothetical protein B5M09_001428 [Aphanomyces astaci]|eukprot:XP_009825355.1 TKL protein kinase [Aphanomyces astaci]